MKRADEMEMAINYKSIRLAYTFLEVGLLIFCFITLATSKELLLVPFILAMASSAIFWFMKLYYTKRMTAGNEDEK